VAERVIIGLKILVYLYHREKVYSLMHSLYIAKHRVDILCGCSVGD
jgi:hypothetical protein